MLFCPSEKGQGLVEFALIIIAFIVILGSLAVLLTPVIITVFNGIVNNDYS